MNAERSFAFSIGHACFAILIFLTSTTGSFARQGPCQFDNETMKFEGSPIEQGRCLLQPVLRGALLRGSLNRLPGFLEQHIGEPIVISKVQYRKYLQRRGLLEDDIGGSLDLPDSETEMGVKAQYFVIHDTSSPLLDSANFPQNIDTPEFHRNDLHTWIPFKYTHVFVNRLGSSITANNFSSRIHGTKLEVVSGKSPIGLFLHVELIQPRRSDPGGHKGNDLIAPVPGFSDDQLQRLALVYVAASIRRGIWLIPAFHAVIDAGLPNGHDDPQNFDLDKWNAYLEQINNEMR